MKLLLAPNKLLEQESLPVTKFDRALRVRAGAMHFWMPVWNGLGLSAVQIGWPKQLMTINTIKADPVNGQKLTICNPEIVSQSGDFSYNEGCLSFPNLFINNVRSNEVLIKYQTTDGEFKEAQLIGVTAFCFLHEYDHFQGKTLDKLIKKG